ncbi:MAG: PIN domain-containing protein [Gallionella sp.]|nr:PIN domain-containing protein [Gallionella sp.]MDH4286049.1 PIN domain-containing protein [Gallionella sp.]
MGRSLKNYLLDSVILIDHFNGRTEATRFLLENHKSAAISVITRAEVLTGFDPVNEVQAKAFLNLFQTHMLTEEDADLAASLRREHRWKLPDALQAAVAINRQLTLATRNSKDFDPARHAFVEIPYRLNVNQS